MKIDSNFPKAVRHCHYLPATIDDLKMVNCETHIAVFSGSTIVYIYGWVNTLNSGMRV